MKYLGVDFGLRRVGLSTSGGELASPWKVLLGKGVNDLVGKLKNEAKDFEKLVIGVPEGKMGNVVKKVAKSLKENGFDVVEADETLSSQKATVRMVELNIGKKKRKINDDIAASIILQDWLDKHNWAPK